jgi:hypothetical protein
LAKIFIICFGKGFNPATFFQLKLGASSDIRTKLVYFDNIFFYKGSTLGVKNFTLSNIAMYPNPVSNELTIEAKNTIQKSLIYWDNRFYLLTQNKFQITKCSLLFHLQNLLTINKL